jgi:alkanesulfonate monooxygenase SsuD/methylene tetrahydromethanopterin reductase-like flavin-dependent oxidoreductase (luciferase family)
MLRIGVLLPSGFTDAGDYLADARALDGAGADSLWLSEDGFDPWLVLAGIATITGRVRLAVPVSARDCEATDTLARRMGTLHRLSRGRVLAALAPDQSPARTEAALDHAYGMTAGRVLLRMSGDGDALLAARLADGLVASAGPAQCHAAFDQARVRRERDHLSAPFELWARAPVPEGRAHWRAVLSRCAQAGATGVLVPFDARLLDLLRNPDTDEDRSDLTLAQG